MNALQLTTAKDSPMLPDWSDPEYRASCERAKREAAAERAAIMAQTGVSIAPDGKITLPVNVSVRRLAPVVVMPLRMHLAESVAVSDRMGTLAVKIAELIEEGYTTVEIRAQCAFEDAAADGDGY